MTGYTQAAAGALTFAGALVRKVKRTFSGVLTFAGGLVRKAKRIFSGVLTFIGDVGRGWLMSTLQVLVRVFKKPAPTFEIEPDPALFVEVIPDPDVNINTNLELNV